MSIRQQCVSYYRYSTPVCNQFRDYDTGILPDTHLLTLLLVLDHIRKV